MKKRFLLIGLLFISLTMQSQILITLLLGDKLNSDGLEFGLEGGVNWTTISGMESNDYLHKFNMGFYFDIRMKRQFSFYTGVLVKSNFGINDLTRTDLTNLGADVYKDQEGVDLVGKYSHKMSYFMVPLLIKYNFKNHFYAEGGFQGALMYKSWIEFNADIEGKDAILKDYNKDKIHRIDVGAMAGLGYNLFKGTGWTVGVKYYYGFIDVYKDINNTKNSSLFVKLNIPIGAGKKPEKPKE